VEPALGHVNQFLEDRPDALQAELDALWARVETLAATPFDPAPTTSSTCSTPAPMPAELALRAAQSA
jgi:hypothetical protein